MAPGSGYFLNFPPAMVCQMPTLGSGFFAILSLFWPWSIPVCHLIPITFCRVLATFYCLLHIHCHQLPSGIRSWMGFMNRYLACIMEVATPTEDCLVLIHELLCPIIKGRGENTLSRQEVIAQKLLSYGHWLCEISNFQHLKLGYSGLEERADQAGGWTCGGRNEYLQI